MMHHRFVALFSGTTRYMCTRIATCNIYMYYIDSLYAFMASICIQWSLLGYYVDPIYVYNYVYMCSPVIRDIHIDLEGVIIR